MEGMAIFGAVVGGLALLAIVLVYGWGEAKTPGWGWKKQVEEDSAATTEAELKTGGQPRQPAGTTSGTQAGPAEASQAQNPATASGTQAGPAEPARSPAASPEEELDQAVQAASRERESSRK